METEAGPALRESESTETEILRSAAPSAVLPCDPQPEGWGLALAARRRVVRLGVVSGLGYRNLRGGLDATSGYLRTLSHVPHRVVKDQDDAAAALDEFADAGIDLVAVSGGDGTISMVATHLLNRPARVPAPALVLLKGGRTNMTAGDVGLPGDQVGNLKRLVAWCANPPSEAPAPAVRPVIGIASPERRPRCGFFVGGGAIYQGSVATWNFRDASHLPLMRTGLGTAASVVRLLAAHVVSRSAFEPSRMALCIDGLRPAEEAWCVVMATTLQRMALGIHPFWGKGVGPIRVTGIAHDHRRLFRAAVKGLLGRRSRHLKPRYGYHSHNAQVVELGLHDGVTLDGEIVRPEGNRLHLNVAGRLSFLRSLDASQG